MPIELAAGEEVGEGVLLDAIGLPVDEELPVGDRLDERGRHDEPADPEGRREGLARRAGVDDPLRVESLQRADGRAVVAVLGVVVVLDCDRVVRAQPGEQLRPPLAGEHDAGRVLMGRGEDDRVDPDALEPVDAEPLPVDCDGDGLEAGAGSDQPLLWKARVLERNSRRAAVGERAADQAEALRVAAGDDEPGRVGDDAAHAPEVGGAVEVAVAATAETLASAAAAGPLLGVWGLGSLAGGVVATRLGGGAHSAPGLARILAVLAVGHLALAVAAGSVVALAGETSIEGSRG